MQHTVTPPPIPPLTPRARLKAACVRAAVWVVAVLLYGLLDPLGVVTLWRESEYACRDLTEASLTDFLHAPCSTWLVLAVTHWALMIPVSCALAGRILSAKRDHVMPTSKEPHA